MADRKYKQHEVEEIFDLATNDPAVGVPALTDEHGLTLAEIQDVGREVGMEPARIAEAARALETRPETVPRGRHLGVPLQ